MHCVIEIAHVSINPDSREQHRDDTANTGGGAPLSSVPESNKYRRGSVPSVQCPLNSRSCSHTGSERDGSRPCSLDSSNTRTAPSTCFLPAHMDERTNEYQPIGCKYLSITQHNEHPGYIYIAVAEVNKYQRQKHTV